MKKSSDGDVSRSNVARVGRNIYLFDEISETSVMESIRCINQCVIESNKLPITMLINSPGGDCYSGLALYDWMRSCKVPITTIGVGIIASMGFIIYLAGDKRLASPNARFLNHQVSSYYEGKASDINVQKAEVDELENILVKIVAERTGVREASVKKDVKFGDNYINSKDAVKKGITHKIINYIDKSATIQLEEKLTKE